MYKSYGCVCIKVWWQYWWSCTSMGRAIMWLWLYRRWYVLLVWPVASDYKTLLCHNTIREGGTSVYCLSITNVCSLSISCLTYILSTHSMTSKYILSTHSMTSEYILSTHSMTSKYILSTHSMTSKYILSTHSMTSNLDAT